MMIFDDDAFIFDMPEDLEYLDKLIQHLTQTE